MIALHKNSICGKIQNRYAEVIYSFEFKNEALNASNELKFEITIDCNAFISAFTANIDGELFHGETKEKTKAKKEYEKAKAKNDNAILISQPNKDIPNVFQISTNIKSAQQSR